MKNPWIIICLSIWAATANSQDRIIVSRYAIPEHFFSVSPVRAIFFDQAGINYEYRYGHLGIGVAAGYKYASGRNNTRLFIATSANHGPFEFYTGYYAMPQLNIYFNKPDGNRKNLLGYFTIKGNYKYLHIDSTAFHVWDNKVQDNNYHWRKQIDQVNIAGVTLGFGYKLIINRFFMDYNFGVGYIYHNHRMLVAAETLVYIPFPSGYNPDYPFVDTYTYSSPTINFCLSFGFCF